MARMSAPGPKRPLGDLGTWPVRIGLYGIVHWPVLLRIARWRLFGIFVGSRLFERQLVGIGRARLRNGLFWHMRETDLTSNKFLTERVRRAHHMSGVGPFLPHQSSAVVSVIRGLAAAGTIVGAAVDDP